MKPVRLFLQAAILSSLALASSASADDWSLFGLKRERGSGDITTEQRQPGEFQRIRLECSADIVVSIDSQYRVTVTTDDNLQDNVITDVIGRKTLVIDTDGNFSSHRGILVEISTPHLVQLEVDGSGSIQIDQLKEETFEVMLDGSGDIEFGGEIKELEIALDGSGEVSGMDLVCDDVKVEIGGSGDVELQGKAQYLECTLSGSGGIDAQRLEAQSVDARTHGSGDISVYATQSFDGAVYGSGDIDVYGNPDDLERSTPGSGEIRRRR
jgi:hypothetical protein